jgi:hypothetical protein
MPSWDVYRVVACVPTSVSPTAAPTVAPTSSPTGSVAGDAARVAARSDVRAEEDVGRRRKVHLERALLELDEPLTVHVTCTNGAGLSSSASLGPLGVDDAPPPLPSGALTLREALPSGAAGPYSRHSVRPYSRH